MTKLSQSRLISIGFTLAELLIALAILGVIATFTIPKILDSGSNSKHNSIVKEAAAAMSEAFQLYKLNNGSIIGTGINEYTPYMNYVRIDTVTVIDSVNTNGSQTCQTGGPCLVLHNGARLWYHLDSGVKLNSTETTVAVWFLIDPDGVYSGSTTGPSKGTVFWLYSNGRLLTYESMLPGTYVNTTGPINPNASLDPDYFSWSN